MNPSCSNPRCSSGFSLIELMLAMLIGLVIMGGVMQLFISTRDTQRASEDQLTVLADARFAIDTIGYDLRHTSVWGRHNNAQKIACQQDVGDSNPCSTPMPVATADCAVQEYIFLARPLFAADNLNPYSATCANESYKAGTDVLSLRYGDTNRIADTALAAGVAYIRTSPNVGMLFVGADFPDSSGYDELTTGRTEYSNHLLVSRVYYVSDYTDAPGDGLPSLRRADLAQGPLMESEVLLAGVEDFQLEFGVDVAIDGDPIPVNQPGDAQVDAYVTADAITNDTGGLGLAWNNGTVLSVRLWLLMRSEREDRDNIGGPQTFTIAGAAPVTFDDGYRRRLVTSVIKLRNTFQIDLQGG